MNGAAALGIAHFVNCARIGSNQSFDAALVLQRDIGDVFEFLTNHVFDDRPGGGIDRNPEIALRKGIKPGHLKAHHPVVVCNGAGFEQLVHKSRKELGQSAKSANQQSVRLLALRYAYSRYGILSERVSLQKDDALEGIRQRTGGREAGNPGAGVKI